MLATLLLCLSATAGEQPLPFEEQPAAIHTDNKDRFYIDFGPRLVRWTDREDRVFTYPAPEGWGVSARHAVSPDDGVVTTLKTISKRECNDKECSTSTAYYKLSMVTCDEDARCSERQLASWSRSSKATSYTTWSANHAVTERGTVLLELNQTTYGGERVQSKTTYTCGGSPCDEAVFEETLFAEMKAPPTHRIDPRKKDFYGEGLPASRRREVGVALLEAMAMTDESFVYDRQGRPHVFYHTNGGRSFAHKYVDTSSGAPVASEDLVDGPESGAANAAVRIGDDGVMAFHYFFRNSYHKGVRATFYEDANAAPVWSVSVDIGEDNNPGWGLQAASTPQGRVMVGYKRDPKNDKRYQLRLFDSPVAVKQAERDAPEGWTADYKSWFALAGLGVGWASWDLRSSSPEAEDMAGVANASAITMDAVYEVPSVAVATATAEAKFGRFVFGASYAQDQLKEELGQAYGQQAVEQFDRLYGMLGMDRIIKYHDIRLAFRRSRLSVGYDVSTQDLTQNPDRNASGVVTSDYQRVDMYLLNTWRVRYGVFQQKYDSYVPFYAWLEPAGSTSYTFVDSFSGRASFSDFGVTIGYSRLDYAAKFENNVFDWFVDGDLGIGGSSATLAQPVTLQTTLAGQDYSEAVERESTIMLPFTAEAGLILLRRSEALRGFGGYGRLGWRADGSLAGSVSKPGDSEEAEDFDSFRVQYSRVEFRQGPFFDAGVVF